MWQLLYDTELHYPLISFPECQYQYVRRPRPSKSWFDEEYCIAERLTRRHQRAFSAAGRQGDMASLLLHIQGCGD